MKKKWISWIIRGIVILLGVKFLWNKDARNWIFGPSSGDIVLDEHGFPTRQLDVGNGIKKIPANQVVIDNSGSWIRVPTLYKQGKSLHFTILTEDIYWQVRAGTNVFKFYPRGQGTDALMPICDNVDFRVDFDRHPYRPESPITARILIEYN